MATDARPGFKLPWSAERTESDPADAPNASTAPDVPSTQSEIEPVAPASDTISVLGPHVAAANPWRIETTPPAPVAETPKRKPNKLMADLTRAMQKAAESARDETLERLQSDAKAFIESVHARSGTEAEAIRHTADADVAGIREWSKAEIARIREETDERITGRKTRLEAEIEDHAGRIEAQIERVQGHVAWFEAEMAGFFERLLAEDDPTRLAAMAENLPEPPAFDDLSDLPVPSIEAPAAEAVNPAVDEASFAAIEAAATTAGTTGAERVTAVAESSATPADPRFAALGLTPEAAAEAEAEAEVDPTADVEEIATFSDDALSARLAGLVPDEGNAPQNDQRTTRVIVTGLVSVASIASFKRHLGKLDGTTSVGVSSGPDGEFIFAVAHGSGVDIAGVLPALPGFAAQVTEITADAITVAARDPETAS